MVPLFNGELNFIGSEKEDCWHLNLRFPHWSKPAYYPKLIFSFDIAKIYKWIEKFYRDAINEKEFFEMANKTTKLNYPFFETSPDLPMVDFPWYEGIQKGSGNNYWLGLYWKNQHYPLEIFFD